MFLSGSAEPRWEMTAAWARKNRNEIKTCFWVQDAKTTIISQLWFSHKFKWWIQKLQREIISHKTGTSLPLVQLRIRQQGASQSGAHKFLLIYIGIRKCNGKNRVLRAFVVMLSCLERVFAVCTWTPHSFTGHRRRALWSGYKSAYCWRKFSAIASMSFSWEEFSLYEDGHLERATWGLGFALEK